jgi:glyoxylase-like metal-dependent hydrolase (beta-lactamase superfamily II)
MTGLNHVRPGGPPLAIEFSETVDLHKVSVGPMDNNAYLLTCAGRSLLIDAAAAAATLSELTRDRTVDTIVTTHRHQDHWQALRALAEQTGAHLVAGRPDVGAIASGAGVVVPEPVWDGDEITVGDTTLSVIGLVGHTPGSIALVGRGAAAIHLFTGDSLFPGGPGKTGSPADFTSLVDDLQSKIFDRFDDDTVVHPGHGAPTTIGAERPHLAEWRARGW